MAGLFSDIQGFFDAKYSGRYLALLLRELARREPQLFADIFGLRPDQRTALRKHQLQVMHEWRFEGQNQRRADLAVLSGGEPILLVEVKEADIGNPQNAAQLKDYLSVLRQPSSERPYPTRFFHVSRFALLPKDRAQLQRAKRSGKLVSELRYREILQILLGSNGPVSAPLRDYLEDIGVASYDVIDLSPDEDGKSIAYLLTQMLAFPHSTGLGKLHSDKAINAIPALFKTLFGNLEVISDWVKENNPGVFHTRFTRKYTPSPHYDLKALARALGKTKAGAGELPGDKGKFVKSGHVYFFALGKIKNPQWTYVELGYGFSISKGDVASNKKTKLARVWLYAGFEWQGHYEIEETNYLSKFPTEPQVLNKLRECLIEAHRGALKHAPKPYRAALKSFKIPPRA